MKTTHSLKQLMMTAIVSLAFMSSVQAADALKIDLTANKIVQTADGKTGYVAAANAKTGETVQYRATYTNVTNQPISDLAVMLPIPASMTFTGVATPNAAQATVDGKNYANIPLMYKVNGKSVKVPLAQYKALRWNIKLLPANKSADITLNTVVN